MEAGDGEIGDAGEHIGEPFLWVQVVEATSRDEGEHESGTIGPALGTGEGSIAAPEGNTSQRALCGVVRETNPAAVFNTDQNLYIFFGQKGDLSCLIPHPIRWSAFTTVSPRPHLPASDRVPISWISEPPTPSKRHCSGLPTEAPFVALTEASTTSQPPAS